MRVRLAACGAGAATQRREEGDGAASTSQHPRRLSLSPRLPLSGGSYPIPGLAAASRHLATARAREWQSVPRDRPPEHDVLRLRPSRPVAVVSKMFLPSHGPLAAARVHASPVRGKTTTEPRAGTNLTKGLGCADGAAAAAFNWAALPSSSQFPNTSAAPLRYPCCQGIVTRRKCSCQGIEPCVGLDSKFLR